MKRYQALCIFFVVLLISSFAVIDSFASTVNVININLQGLRGIRTQLYFESANASTTRTPITVNTATTVPTTNSSYRLYSGDSAYLWTPQFSSETIIHTASKMTLDIWAGATPEMNIDASNAVLSSGTALSVALSTTEPNTVIYAVVSISASSDVPVTMSGAGLTWQLRGTAIRPSMGCVKTYWAIAPSLLTSATITASISGTTSYDFALLAFVASGIDPISPFNSNLPVPATNNSVGGAPSVTFTISGQNNFVIGALWQNSKKNSPDIVAGSGYTLITSANGKSMAGAIEYKDSANAGSHTVTFGSTTQAWAIIGDALVPASAGGNISVSAYITDSSGTRLTTLINNQTGNPTPQNGGQVATTFSIPAATISAGGYIEFVITAPSSCGIIVSWGRDTPTNIQLCTVYSSPV